MEEENNKKITIADVAKLAGVSKGTVDRVSLPEEHGEDTAGDR